MLFRPKVNFLDLRLTFTSGLIISFVVSTQYCCIVSCDSESETEMKLSCQLSWLIYMKYEVQCGGGKWQFSVQGHLTFICVLSEFKCGCG